MNIMISKHNRDLFEAGLSNHLIVWYVGQQYILTSSNFTNLYSVCSQTSVHKFWQQW